MLLRLLGRIVGAVGIMAGVWLVGALPDSEMRPWVQPVGEPRGPVRIVRFYASSARITAGDIAQLCYGVENAKSVRISPSVTSSLPAGYRCVDIMPDHTTHYTIIAEGFDGSVVTEAPLKIIVETTPDRPHERSLISSLQRRDFSLM